MKIYLDVQQAADRYNLDPDLLQRLAEEGKIRAGLFEGKLLLLEDDVANEVAKRVDKAEFAHLDSQRISVREATKKYGLPTTSLLQWAAKGHIRIEGREGRKVFLNEADVAYAHRLAEIKKPRRGQTLFPREG